MQFLLKNRYTPGDAEAFRARLREFLTQVERGAKRIDTSNEDLYLAKYAWCALMDEMVLSQQGALTEQWRRNPLQLELFGEQLAGEAFFDKLESLRAQGAAKVQVLEVFHMCLLMGFQGKYLIEGTEKLGYLTARLGDEIATHKGQRAAFAPHAYAGDQVRHKLRADVPLWVMGSVLALAALLAFLGMRWALAQRTQAELAPFAQVITLPAQSANVTITLP
ncbi:MAG: type IVB secretion system protein IcmH/DotU [Rubrivivax sp.]|nr:type IVB secretion system protein IcmH/DotU [Rubrivivax sp.]